MQATSHFILYVADQARSAAFYEATLGVTPRLDVPGMTEFALPGGAVLGLMSDAAIVRLLGADKIGRTIPIDVLRRSDRRRFWVGLTERKAD